MNKLRLLYALLIMTVLAGCAASSKVETKGIMHEVPNPAEGESAVFGKVTLLETVNDLLMPANDAAGDVYVVEADVKRMYKIRCSAAGEFGVYLPAGDYKLVRISLPGYNFQTDLSLSVPADQKAVYVGDIVLDGTPTGVLPGTDGLLLVSKAKRFFSDAPDTRFVYSVKDHQKDFEASVRAAIPDADIKLAKSILTPRGGLATGYYPNKVYRSKDKLDTIAERGEETGEFIGYVCSYLDYYLLPFFFQAEH